MVDTQRKIMVHMFLFMWGCVAASGINNIAWYSSSLDPLQSIKNVFVFFTRMAGHVQAGLASLCQSRCR